MPSLSCRRSQAKLSDDRGLIRTAAAEAVTSELRAFESIPSQHPIQVLPEVAHMVGDDGAGPEHRLAVEDLVHVGQGHRQAPEEAGQALDVAGVLQGLAHDLHLGGGEGQRGYGQDGAGCYNLVVRGREAL